MRIKEHSEDNFCIKTYLVGTCLSEVIPVSTDNIFWCRSNKIILIYYHGI